MSDDTDISRFVDNVLELGVVRMRMLVGPTAQESYRPRMCLWVDQRSGMILQFEMTEPLESYLPLVVNSLRGAIERIGGLPRQIQLRDPRLASELREALEPARIEVVVRESLPMLDEAIDSMMENKKLSGNAEPGLLDVPGMTLDHVIAFADAARAFYDARPWQHLIDDDLIAIESPAGPAGTQFTQVLGAGGEVSGLGFVPSRQAHEDIRADRGLPRGGMWSLLFGDIDQLQFEDGEAWERHGLAVAGPEGYPSFVRVSKSKGATYPTPEQLVWAEGLLRALTATTEEELDRGRWEKQVDTFSGPATYRLSMPFLLEQMSGKSAPDPVTALHVGRLKMEPMLRAIGQQIAEHGEMTQAELNEFTKSLLGKPQVFTPTTDAERAQALCYEAHESRGRRQLQLARQALAIDPDCVDALVLLGERATEPQAAIALYKRAVEAGERQLGRERFEKDAGHFWGIVETRPYMRARQQLAMTHLNLGEFDQAAEHFKELLRLNPNDNQGNRYFLAQSLLNSNQLDALDELLNRSAYKDDFSAEWVFTRSLLEYRRKGDSPDVRRSLNQAHKRNPFVAPLLTGRAPMPPNSPPSYTPGSVDEAIVCVEQIADGWHQTAGAIEWLESVAVKEKKRGRQQSRARDKKRKRR